MNSELIIDNYQVKEHLYIGKHYTVLRALKEGEDQSVILKMADKSTGRTLTAVKNLKREYDFLGRIRSAFVVKPLEWIENRDYAILVLEDTGGQTLKDTINGQAVSIDNFLHWALAVIYGLEAIHRRNIIHKDINPTNIIVNPEGGNLKIIDFNISSTYDMKVSYIGNPEELHGTLPYISPEQTGRVNRRVDQRTDLYSLGIMFYELLTGQLPFQHSTPIEIVYDHLARLPEVPHHLNPKIPGILSRIILKLIAKNPEERYQSASGLKHDLVIFQAHRTKNFKLGLKDFTGKLHIPEKLYGREKEVSKLLTAYRAVSKGAREMTMVTGYSGTGKTSLVQEIQTPVTRDRGFFISAKFDQLQRTIPYSAFISALNQLCRLLLTEKQELLDLWKVRILRAVGKLGKVLTDVVPELRTVIGSQPPVPILGAREAKRRFNYILMRFIQAVAGEEHPLVIFIDDLQWADQASLELMQFLMEDQHHHHLFFIGSYRDNEVSPTHPLAITLETLQTQQVTIHTIALQNLSFPHVKEWLRDTMRIKEGSTGLKEVEELSGLIYKKTQGNAFFTIRFLKNLYENELLRFNFTNTRWTWDVNEILKQNITDNVVDLLVAKIQTLAPEVREVLKRAACIGHTFDRDTLAVISPDAEGLREQALETAIMEELIIPTDRAYRFVHDRIHQAAYLLISEEEKKFLHLGIGRLLLDRIDHEEPGFDVVNHLNIGASLIDRKEEKRILARLNLESCRKARLSGAFKLAAHYVLSATELLPEHSWQKDYHLTLAIYDEAVQASFLTGDLAGMDHFIDAVLNHAHSLPESSLAYEHRVTGLIATNKLPQAIDTLLTIFSQVGLYIPPKPGKRRTHTLVNQIRTRLEHQGIKSLTRLPDMEDPGKKLASRLFYTGSPAFAYAAQDMTLYTTAAMTGVILDHGLSAESPFILSGFGTKMIHLGDIPGGYQLGEIAMELLEKGIGDDAIRNRAIITIAIYLSGNKQHYKSICQLMTDTYLRAMETGDIAIVGYILTNYIMCLSRTDTDLAIVFEKAHDMKQTVDQLKQSILNAPLLIEIAAASALLGKSGDPSVLDMTRLEPLFQAMHGDMTRIYRWQVNIKQILLGLLFNNSTHLLAHCREAEDHWNHLTSPITYIKSDYYFYLCLAYLRMCDGETAGDSRKTYLAKARKTIRVMKQWAKLGPVNFLHKYYLMQAEIDRVTGKSKRAEEFYEKAVETAYENRYINEAALANELAARFYIKKNQHKLAAIYLVEARDCYKTWGAAAKVKQLETAYPKYLRIGAAGSTVTDRTYSTLTTQTAADLIDVKSLLKASQALAREVQLKGLLEKMMHILIENAGAQKSLLIREQSGRLLIQAEGGTDGVTGVMKALPVQKSGKVPMSVINYVANGMTPLVFDNISKDPAYSNDPYIQTHQPKSLVCFPISKHGLLSAIIYLEHGQVEGAFTPARMEILNMLSAQIAISVENTELVENLEEKVKQRTEALQKTHEHLERNHRELEESHGKINDSVNYASRIQEAVLPSREIFSELFPRHFLIYWPCSTVSGDFYWIKQVGKQIVVAAADCTGHGVPGALVSMLGMAFLNEIVMQMAMIEMNAAEILDQLRSQVKTALGQKDQHNRQKEGMDIALCVIDSEKKELQYSGAYNPLYLIRDSELTEIKADRMPIGIYRKENSFTNHQISYNENDMLYLFSDGYPDQNGDELDGEAKFTKKRFKDLLVEISTESIDQQERILTRRFDQFKGSQPQRDDVLIIGIRL